MDTHIMSLTRPVDAALPRKIAKRQTQPQAIHGRNTIRLSGYSLATTVHAAHLDAQQRSTIKCNVKSWLFRMVIHSMTGTPHVDAARPPTIAIRQT